MQPKILSTRIWLVIVLTGLILIFTSIYYFIFSHPVKNISIPSDEQTKISTELPVQLKIPSLNIIAAIESVSLTSGGAMDTPKNPANVAWYNIGPRPGEIGSAVMAGHFGQWKNGQGSIFENLHQLKIADKIYVVDSQGATTTFVVKDLRRYDPKADTTSIFNSTDDGSHLNLITCDGNWDKTTKSYPERLVVFTDKVIPNQE